MKDLLFILHLDKIVMAFNTLKYLKRPLPVHEYLVLTGGEEDKNLISFLERSILGTSVEVFLLSNLASTKLIMRQIPSILELVP